MQTISESPQAIGEIPRVIAKSLSDIPNCRSASVWTSVSRLSYGPHQIIDSRKRLQKIDMINKSFAPFPDSACLAVCDVTFLYPSVDNTMGILAVTRFCMAQHTSPLEVLPDSVLGDELQENGSFYHGTIGQGNTTYWTPAKLPRVPAVDVTMWMSFLTEMPLVNWMKYAWIQLNWAECFTCCRFGLLVSFNFFYFLYSIVNQTVTCVITMNPTFTCYLMNCILVLYFFSKHS